MIVGFCLVSDSHDGLSLSPFRKVPDALRSLGVRFSNSISIKKQRIKIQFYYAIYKLTTIKEPRLLCINAFNLESPLISFIKIKLAQVSKNATQRD